MIKTGEADARRARNVAHRSGVIALLGKNARRRAEDQFKLLIVARKTSFQFDDPLLHWERGRPARNLRSGSPSMRAGRPRSQFFALPHNRTYSNSNGLPLIPDACGAIQLAILPGSVTVFIRLRTYSRSSTVGSQSVFRRSNSSFVIKFPARSKWCPAYSPT